MAHVFHRGGPVSGEVEARSMRERLTLLAKVTWLVAILGLTVWYLSANWTEIVRYAERLHFAQLVGATSAVILSRVLLAGISRLALEMNGSSITWRLSFWINAVSQLGKYIPGSVWHFVGRLALYKRHGLSVAGGSGVLVVENAALLLSGASVGLISLVDVLRRADHLPGGMGVVVAAVVAAAAAWWAMVRWLPRLVGRWFTSFGHLRRAMLYWLCLGLWASFGVAFWLLLPVDNMTVETLLLATGTFALAWIVGNLAPFAPAGIGVREAVIVALLAPELGVTMAVGVAAASRVVWTIAELGVAPVAGVILARTNNAADTRSAS